MCDPVTIGVSLAGAVLSKAMAPKPPKAPKAPTMETPPEKQASKAPEADDVRRGNAARGQGSGYTNNQSTLLTGPTGENEAELNLGQAILLGA